MQNNSSVALQCLKSVIIAVIFSLISVLVFAVILKIFSVSSSIIKPINYLIKCASVFLGCYFSISGEKGAIKGLVFGILIIVICFLLFSLLNCNFAFTLNLFWEVLFGGVVGFIAGVFAVNKK